MARQDSMIKFVGQMGGISFYKTGEDGHLARQKGGIDGDRIKKAPEFERTRENGEEFARAGVASRLLRTALRALIMNIADGRMSSRLTSVMAQVVKADETSRRGKRNVIDGDIDLLTGFEFNLDARVEKTFFPLYSKAINRATGELSVNIPAFIPQNMIAPPEGTTHCSLIMAGVEMDFEAKRYVVNTSQSLAIELGPQNQPALVLTTAMPPASTKPLFIAFGIEFYQRVGGQLYPLKNGTYNALALVAVDGGA